MAVHQDYRPERLMRLVDQPPQRTVIRLVQRLDAAQRVVDAEALAIDLLAVADDARNGAEPAGDPHRPCVGEAREPSSEHPRVEFVGLAIDVDIGARKIDSHSRETAL